MRLVDALRASDAHVADLELVAEIDGAVVGHVMVTWAVLAAHPVRRVLNLSPLSVDPFAQGQGIGSDLVRAIADGAAQRDEPLVVLEGDPTFYGRLGYGSAAEVGIDLSLPPWAPPEAAQVILLPTYKPHLRGRVIYPPPFDEVGEH